MNITEKLTLLANGAKYDDPNVQALLGKHDGNA